MKKLNVTFNEDMIPELYLVMQIWCKNRSNTFDFIRRGIEENFPEIAERLKMQDGANGTSLAQWADYTMGAMAAVVKMIDEYIDQKPVKGEKPYREAEMRFITANRENLWQWLTSRPGQFRYRNHEKDKKGNLTKVEAYIKP